MLGMNLKDSRLPEHERRLRTVLADPEGEERAFYERTSIYPIMHCVVIRNDVLEAHAGYCRCGVSGVMPQPKKARIDDSSAQRSCLGQISLGAHVRAIRR
jgi:hypothetical protein